MRQVLQQIRWKRARTVIGQELQNHLEDQYQAFLEEGLPPTEAEAETVRQMGDPVSVGKALDALHRPRREWSFLWLALLLLGCGILLSLANAGFQWNRIFQARLGCAVIGLVLGVLLYFWDGKLLCDRPVLLAVLLGLVPLFARRFYSSSFDLTFDQGLLLLPLAMGLPCGQIVLTVAVLSILITAPLGSFFIDRTYRKLLKPEEPLTDSGAAAQESAAAL